MKPAFGIILKVVSALAFTLMSAGIKRLGSDYPVGEIVFFRSACAVIPLLIWLGWRGDLVHSLRTNDLKGHVLRGFMGTSSMFASFVALSYLPLPDAVAIGYASPLITVVLAAVILKETVRVYRWSAVVVGFVGVLIMLAPHFGDGLGPAASGSSAIGALFSLLGACCAAGSTIQVRRLTATEKTGAIVLYFSLFAALLGLATVVLGWRAPPPGELALLVLIGILGGIGQILVTQSYRFADTSLVAPFEYTTMIWALLIGWFAFGQMPEAALLIGGFIVAAAGLFVIWREHRLGLIRVKEVEASSQRPA